MFEQKRGQPARIVATGRESWAGWIELKKEPIADDAVLNTARVIASVQPDILIMVEVESRPAVQHFHDKVLLPLLKEPYPYNMVIDGNDERGIDVGILRKRFPLALVAGDLNDYPTGGSLNALLQRTNLVDAMSLKQYQGAFPGTYAHATANEKIDYLLLSPALRKKVRAVDVFRKGFYAPRKWESFENINKVNKDRFQASDHHCLWAELDV